MISTFWEALAVLLGGVWAGTINTVVGSGTLVSFPILVLTLAAGYGQVVDASYSLPVIGHLPPVEWVTEGIAWASLLGIVYLIALRQVIRPRSTVTTVAATASS